MSLSLDNILTGFYRHASIFIGGSSQCLIEGSLTKLGLWSLCNLSRSRIIRADRNDDSKSKYFYLRSILFFALLNCPWDLIRVLGVSVRNSKRETWTCWMSFNGIPSELQRWELEWLEFRFQLPWLHEISLDPRLNGLRRPILGSSRWTKRFSWMIYWNIFKLKASVSFSPDTLSRFVTCKKDSRECLFVVVRL